MKVRPRRVAGRAFVTNDVPPGDDLPARHAAVEPRQVAVQRRVAVAVNDDDVVPVAVSAGIERDDTGVGGDDRRPVRTRDVDARMDPVRVRTGGVVLLEPVAVAAERLADALMPA